jgi:hypothetical protein
MMGDSMIIGKKNTDEPTLEVQNGYVAFFQTCGANHSGDHQESSWLAMLKVMWTNLKVSHPSNML